MAQVATAATADASFRPLTFNDEQVVVSGRTVILDFAGKQYFATATLGTSKVHNLHVSTTELIGLPYGCVVEVIDGKFVRTGDDAVLPPVDLGALNGADGDGDGDDDDEDDDENDVDDKPMQQPPSSSVPAVRDNRNTFDTNTSQQLSQSSIVALRTSGASGSSLVAALIVNSSTFSSKTEFSKAKYIKRKQMKYQPRARLLKCSPSSIAEVLFAKSPCKYLNLRSDSLAQVLSYANVYAGSQVLCFDTTGLILGSLAARLSGYGRVLAVYDGQDPPFKDILWKFNLSYAETDVLKWLSTYELFGDGKNKREQKRGKEGATTAKGTAKADTKRAEGDKMDGTTETEDKEERDDDDNGDDYRDILTEEKDQLLTQGWPVTLLDHTVEYLHKKSRAEVGDFLLKRSSRFIRKLCRPSLLETLSWLESKSDSLIIATPFHPLPILLALFPHLAPSCPFVVFCEHIEPLAECFQALKKGGLAIKLQLSETWMREYQVMHNCTHPQMTMSATGGFILTGTKVSEHEVQVEKKGKFVGMGVGALKHSNRNNMKKQRRDEER